MKFSLSHLFWGVSNLDHPLNVSMQGVPQFETVVPVKTQRLGTLNSILISRASPVVEIFQTVWLIFRESSFLHLCREGFFWPGVVLQHFLWYQLHCSVPSNLQTWIIGCHTCRTIVKHSENKKGDTLSILGNTENISWTAENCSATRVLRAAKLMKIVFFVWGFNSRPMMWLSFNQLCLRGERWWCERPLNSTWQSQLPPW